MIYSPADVTLDTITPNEFENLCYDLLLKYNFSDLIWRQGGADDGRDIEARYTSQNPIANAEEKWYFECKRYTNGVPPAELNSKIAWADAGNPHFLVFFVSSYITNSARDWLTSIQASKNYRIIVIEGEEIKNRVAKYDDLVERYFSNEKYEKMFKDIKDYSNKHNISPSYEFLKELIENLDLTKLEVEDFEFLLFSFYGQFDLFDSRNNYTGDFDETIPNRLIVYIKENTSNDSLASMEPYKNNLSHLAGTGIMDQLVDIDNEEFHEYLERYNFQDYVLHINHDKEQKQWKIGKYLFVIVDDVAIELFQDTAPEIRIIKDFNPDKFEELSVAYEGACDDYKKYLELTK